MPGTHDVDTWPISRIPSFAAHKPVPGKSLDARPEEGHESDIVIASQEQADRPQTILVRQRTPTMWRPPPPPPQGQATLRKEATLSCHLPACPHPPGPSPVSIPSPFSHPSSLGQARAAAHASTCHSPQAGLALPSKDTALDPS